MRDLRPKARSDNAFLAVRRVYPHCVGTRLLGCHLLRRAASPHRRTGFDDDWFAAQIRALTTPATRFDALQSPYAKSGWREFWLWP